MSNQVAEIMRRSIGRSVPAHALRHSFAARQIQRSGKIEAVSRYMGHSTPAITMGYYVHESLDDGELLDE